MSRTARLGLILALAWLAGPRQAGAQDLEPRRWTHLPVGTHIVGLSYLRTQGDLGLDPLLEIQDGEVRSDTLVASYARSFDLLGKTARLDLILPYQRTRWDGELSGTPTSATREGFADPWVRLSVDVAGAPALQGKEYLDYRGAHPVNTVAGVALCVGLPLGEYIDDKLLNLGSNRFAFRPQAGVVHSRGPWSYELTGSVFLFTDNDEFLVDERREQDPLFEFQGHVIHTFPNQSWLAGSAGYAWGGASTIDGVSKDDERGDLLSSVSFGFPVGQSQSLKLVYLRVDTQQDVGSDTDNLLLAWSVRL